MITWIVLKNLMKWNYQLPAEEQFYSILNDQHVTNEEYDHARIVWKTFNIKTMTYTLSDVLLPADVFESFRKTCL